METDKKIESWLKIDKIVEFVGLGKLWRFTIGQKKTNWNRLFKIFIIGFMSIVAMSSIRLGIKYNNGVWYLVAWWQICYGFMWLLFVFSDNLVKRSQKLTRETFDLCDKIMLDRLEEIKLSLTGGREYLIGKNKDGLESILCVACGSISYSSEDIKNLYCGNCHKFHKKNG